MDSHKKNMVLGWIGIAMIITMVAAVVTMAYAAVTVPNTFSAGTTISASQVNANFTALANGINAKYSPIAYGYVTGAGARNSGSTNFTASWDATNSRYLITITGYNYHYASFTTVVTPAGGPYHVGTNSLGGQLIVQFWNAAGTAVQTTSGFQFATFQ